MKTAITQARVALSQWEQRIAPVFDVARQLQLVEIADGQVRQTSAGAFSGDFPMERALYLRDWRADTLICGAISRPVHEMIAAYGIRVVPFVAGGLDEVLQAWLDGTLASDRFAMPGCCGRGRRRGAGGAGRRAARLAQGPGPQGTCVCPQCGHRESHARGVPCVQIRCPVCGSTLIRGED